MQESLIDIYSIAEVLKHINLGDQQKREHFHILRFEDDIEKLPNEVYMKSESYFEVTVVKKSKSEILIDDTRFSSDKDIINFLSPGQTINVTNGRAGKHIEGYIIFFTVDFLDFSPTVYNTIQRFPYFNMNFSPMYFLSEDQSRHFFKLMESMYQKFKVPTPTEDDFEIIKSYLTILLFEAKQVSDELVHASHSRAEEITYQFENLLKQKEKRGLVRDYADVLNISPIYLSECVKSITGKSAKKVITEYRLREAKSLLTYTEKNIDEIARIIGFDDRSNFINFFKKHVGQSPNMYRKTHL